MSEFWSAKELSIWQRFKYRFFTQGSNHIAIAISNGASSVVVPFLRTEQDTNYGVVARTTYSTTIYCTQADKAVGQVTIRFGTAAPSGNEKVDVIIFRSED